MTITNSTVALNIVKKSKSKAGTLYFFDHFAVVEFNEGVHVDLSSAKDTIYDLMNYFGESRPFGLIANRVNSYSISLLDAQEIKTALPNLAAYGVVSHNHASNMNAKIEDSFCETQMIHFNDLHECLDSIYHRVKQSIITSFN